MIDILTQENIKKVEQVIDESCKKAGRNRGEVTLIAVSKTKPVETLQEAYNIGVRVFGENKVQDLRAKIESLDDLPLEWHFIGNLQENKINTLLSLNPTLLHSLDSIKLALALQKRLGEQKIRALLQVNAANEESKSGVSVESAKEIYEHIDTGKNVSNDDWRMTKSAHNVISLMKKCGCIRDKSIRSYERRIAFWEDLQKYNGIKKAIIYIKNIDTCIWKLYAYYR